MKRVLKKLSPPYEMIIQIIKVYEVRRQFFVNVTHGRIFSHLIEDSYPFLYTANFRNIITK